MNKETNQKKSFSFGFWSKDCVYLEIECFGWCESDWYFFGLDEMFFTGRRPTRGFWSGPRWTRRFFVLKRHTLYGYRDPEVSSLESTFFLLFFFLQIGRRIGSSPPSSPVGGRPAGDRLESISIRCNFHPGNRSKGVSDTYEIVLKIMLLFFLPERTGPESGESGLPARLQFVLGRRSQIEKVCLQNLQSRYNH